MCIGGPALIYYVSPSEEELFKACSTWLHLPHFSLTPCQRYNPELQKRSLENRKGKQEDFDNFVGKLKEYSRSNKPIWEAAADDEARTRANTAEERRRIAAEIQQRRDEIKRQSLGERWWSLKAFDTWLRLDGHVQNVAWFTKPQPIYRYEPGIYQSLFISGWQLIALPGLSDLIVRQGSFPYLTT